MEKRIKELELLIEEYTKKYSKGESDIENVVFESWVEELELLSPNSKALILVEDFLGEGFPKVTLPFKLYSQKKIKSKKDIDNWIKDISSKIKNFSFEEEIIITPKYDGLHLLNFEGRDYTRGKDGIIGQDVTSRTNEFLNKSISFYGFGGELIFSKENFKKYFSQYTNSRNVVPALFSNDTVLKNADKVSYIRYSIYNDNSLSKKEQLNICNLYNEVKIPYYTCTVKDIFDLDSQREEILDKLFEVWSKEFVIDGLILEINSATIRNVLGYNNKYPQFSRAYKPEKFNGVSFKTKIEDLKWQISRYGKLTPVAKVEGREINEGMVTSVSLYNAKYVLDNNIHIGQEGYIFRAGFINPKFAFFEKDNFEGEILPTKCPNCSSKLAKTGDNKYS